MSDAPVLQSREQIELLERDIERLRVMYQQYFMGTLKTEPLTLRKHIYRQILQAKPGQINNTGTRFKLRNLIQKWNGYLQMWKRTVRQMEEGTFRRDLERVRKRRNVRGAPQAERAEEEAEGPGVIEMADDLSAAELERQLVAAMAQEAAQRPATSEAPAAASAQEQAMIDLVMKRQAQGLSLDGLDLSGLGGD